MSGKFTAKRKQIQRERAALSSAVELLPALLESGMLYVICLQMALKWPRMAIVFWAHRCVNERPPAVGCWQWR